MKYSGFSVLLVEESFIACDTLLGSILLVEFGPLFSYTSGRLIPFVLLPARSKTLMN